MKYLHFTQFVPKKFDLFGSEVDGKSTHIEDNLVLLDEIIKIEPISPLSNSLTVIEVRDTNAPNHFYFYYATEPAQELIQKIEKIILEEIKTNPSWVLLHPSSFVRNIAKILYEKEIN